MFTCVSSHVASKVTVPDETRYSVLVLVVCRLSAGGVGVGRGSGTAQYGEWDSGLIFVKMTKLYWWLKTSEFYESGSTQWEFIQLLLSYRLFRYEEKQDQAPTHKKHTIHKGRQTCERLHRTQHEAVSTMVTPKARGFLLPNVRDTEAVSGGLQSASPGVGTDFLASSRIEV